MSVMESVEHAKEQAASIAVMCADLQYNPGSTPSAFLGTAALFSGVASGAFYLVGKFGSESIAQSLKKLSITAAGVGAAGLAGLDTVTYAGHRIRGTAPDDRPTVIDRMLDTEVFQQHILDSKLAPLRCAGVGLVISHAFAKGITEPNYGQVSE